MNPEEIIRKKKVDIDTLKKVASVSTYNILIGKKKLQLTEDEFKAVKRYLK